MHILVIVAGGCRSMKQSKGTYVSLGISAWNFAGWKIT